MKTLNIVRIITHLILLTAVGCSKHNVNLKGIPNKVEVDTKPIDVKLKLQLEEASKECDRRFGEGTDKSNICFMAYLQFFKIEISLDVTSIQDYCDARYAQDLQGQKQCFNDLTDLLTNLGRI